MENKTKENIYIMLGVNGQLTNDIEISCRGQNMQRSGRLLTLLTVRGPGDVKQGFSSSSEVWGAGSAAHTWQ